MNELIHFLVLGKAFGKHIEYVVADMLRPAELLEIQWIHIQLGQVPDRYRAYIFELDSKWRAGKRVIEPTIIYKELNCGDHFLATLDLVKENQGFAGY